jgi:uncharacterized protein (DUF1501 family)
MTLRNIDRRALLRMGGALGVLGAGAPLAMQLAAAGAAAAQTATDYKAIVCVFMLGGNDGANTVLATDSDTWGRYWSARWSGQDPIALMPPGTPPMAVGQVSPVTGRKVAAGNPEAWGGVLPIVPNVVQPIPPGTQATVRTFGLHPFLGPVQALFDRQRLAVVANLGTLIQPISKAQYSSGSPLAPANLFSHNDQQSFWQSGMIEGAQVGWGGAMADLLFGLNGTNSAFTSISSSGGAVFLAGRDIGQYAISPGGQPATYITGAQGASTFGSPIGPSLVSSGLQDASSTSDFANDYAAVVTRSINAAGTITQAVSQGAAATVAPPPAYTSPITGLTQPNPLAQQFQAVAELIAAAPQLGLRRQIFFLGMSTFDSHAGQNASQPDLLGQLAQALAYFDSTLSNLGGVDHSASVTTFTASEFGRTFTTNGSGTDHAWGSHHFVMGWAVKGGNIYGQYPTLGIDLGGFNNPNMVGAALIPTTSVDQYGATLGAWLGVPTSSLPAIFPNLANFATSNLGFV